MNRQGEGTEEGTDERVEGGMHGQGEPQKHDRVSRQHHNVECEQNVAVFDINDRQYSAHCIRNSDQRRRYHGAGSELHAQVTSRFKSCATDTKVA